MKPTLTIITVLTMFVTACGDARPESVLDSAARAKFGVEDPNASVNLPRCDEVATWPGGAQTQEDAFLPLINDFRAKGAQCGDANMPPVPPVQRSNALTCAARWHAQDMGKRGFFSHDTPEGNSAPDRLRAAHYTFRAWGENIARGAHTAQAVLDVWAKSPPHCATMMGSGFTEIGLGYYPATDPNGPRKNLWALDLGAPAGAPTPEG